MSFEKTKASAEKNSVQEIEKDLNEEEDTSSTDGQVEENEVENEEDTSTNEAQEAESQEEEKVTLSKAEYEKMVKERDNYKQGMLSAKAKRRSLVEVEENEKPQVDVNEEVVMGVLSKQKEKEALRNTITPKHQDFIPELIDDNQYNEIIGYLPRNVDKTSYESIVKGLKLATKLWKEERGIVDKPVKKQTDLHTTKSASSSAGNLEVKKASGRKILKSGRGPGSWYN